LDHFCAYQELDRLRNWTCSLYRKSSIKHWLALFTVAFFGSALIAFFKATKNIGFIGKILNPLFDVLSVLMITAFYQALRWNNSSSYY